MEYKVIHTADIQAELDAHCKQGWELFDVQAYRVPASPAQWLVIMERDETTAMDFADSITLNTIVSWANARTINADALNDFARGFNQAVKDVKAILAVHGQPPDTPVIYGGS